VGEERLVTDGGGNRSQDLLAEGRLVSMAAARVGFASTNGYILAFRRYFGQTPART
jgi:AraC-like DNA-binding protein